MLKGNEWRWQLLELLIRATVLKAHGQNKTVPQCSVKSDSFARVADTTYIAQGGSKPQHGWLSLANSSSTAENSSYDEMDGLWLCAIEE
jgi:hypothetical protein